MMMLECAVAIPGYYFTSGSLVNKWLPNPLETITVLNRETCEVACVESKTCNGFAVSVFERKCRLYDVQAGTPPVKNNGYVLYIKKKTREEGYYDIGTQYLKLMYTRTNAKDAAKICAKEKGLLVSVRNKEIEHLLWELMIDHSVWSAYIGVSDEEEEGVWKYSDTGPVTYSNWDWNGMWPREDLNCALIVNTQDGAVWKHATCWENNFFFCQIPMF